MGSVATLPRPASSPPPALPLLESGDRLTRAEFERRYEAMPDRRKAELIEGVVYVSSPVRIKMHANQTSRITTWLGNYWAKTPGADVGDNVTLRLDLDNEPQPDAILRILPEAGGQSRTDVDGFVEGGPELVVEVTASSASIDLHDKFRAYRRNHVREYLVWRVLDGELDWFVWREGRYERLAPDTSGVYRSEVFPGLWLDAPALLRGDLAAVLTVLQQGIGTPEHQGFVERLRAAS